MFRCVRDLVALLAIAAAPSAALAQEKVTAGVWGGGVAATTMRNYGEPFRKETGLGFDVVEVPDPSAAISAARGQPQFNVGITAAWQAATLARKGLIEELTPEDLPALRNIPERYWVKSDSGKFVGMPTYFSYYGIAYNTDLAKAEDFSSWSALADPKWRKKVSITRPVFSTPYDLTLFSKINGGDERDVKPGLDLFKKFAGNALSAYTSMANLQSQLTRGEVAAAPYYSVQVVIMKRAGVKNVEIALPREGGLAIPFVYVIPKGAKDLAAAKRFLNFVVGVEPQQNGARDGYLPLNPDAKLPPELEKEFGLSLADVMSRTYSPNWNVISANLDARLRTVEEIMDEAR